MLFASQPGLATRARADATGDERAPTRARAGWSWPVDAAQDVTRVLLGSWDADEDVLARLESRLDEHVHLWTPAVHTTTRFELVRLLADLDDAISDVVVDFDDVVEARLHVCLTWTATGRFAQPALIDDDRLVEPTGSLVQVAGATVVTFTEDRRASAIRCYYDRQAIVDQLDLGHHVDHPA